MRLCYLFTPVCLLFATTAHADRSFPYKAYVVSEDVYVRSGPGKNYYPTQKLKVGQEVEVHRHDPGGWYAIKPPEGSFTWVSGRYLQKKGKGLAVVTGDRVGARVGSQLSDIRDVIQVRLERGEVVEILEEKQFASGSEAGMWYKIAPPSGEFRWVFGKFVDYDFPHDGIRRSSGSEDSPLVNPRRTPPDAVVKGAAEKSPASSQPREREVVTGQGKTARVSMASRELRHDEPGSITRSGPVARPPDREPPADRDPPRVAVVEPPPPSGPPRDAPPMRRLSPEEYADELEALELQLSVMLAEEPSVWEFGELDTKARWLLAQGETALERGKARLVLNKIAQAADIKRRNDDINNTQLAIERSDRRLAEMARRRVEAGGPTEAQSRFDGTGRLTRVVPSKLGAPQYALVDEKGAVRCYVTPAPGVNLRYYEGRQVGIDGIRGYIAEQNAQHLTAKHVAPLEDTRLR